MSNLSEKSELFPLLLDNLGFLIGRTGHIKDRLLERYMAYPALAEEITATQAKVLFQIYKFQSYRPSDIGKMLNVDKSNITRMVERLEKKDLIQRQPDPEDRRSFLLYLTDKGRALVEQAVPLAMNALAELEQVLNEEEQAQLRHCLRKIVTAHSGAECPTHLVKGTK
ncbi:MarR family winged helix-turn-helix transcriptional regulator [Shewanella sp.]|uniref:MarR family winged helix-turn-helix transcriptional regulator n=1 Tax=Shewanella sp. TaxID=50422 RepID=UPI003A985F5B